MDWVWVLLWVLLVGALGGIVAILWWPRRRPYARRITRTRNGQPRWKELEKH